MDKMRKLMILTMLMKKKGDSALKKKGDSALFLRIPIQKIGRCPLFFVMTAALILLAATSARANDVDAYNVSLQSYNSTSSPNTVDVQFSLSQKNVFPVGLTDGNGATYNYRIWVFVKYFKTGPTAWPANTAWKHATLMSGGSIGTYSGGVGITDGKGAFCRTGVNQTLRWAIGTDESSDTETMNGTATYKVRVFAIEMVLVPTGAFWVGSGGSESGSLTNGSWTSGATVPLKITSQGAINIAQTDGCLWGTSSSGNSTIGPAGSTGANFPTGYNAFYCMKYEISQGQYVDFLNTLTREQQSNASGNARTATYFSSSDTSSGVVYALSSARNTVYCSTVSANLPIPFYAYTPWEACNDLCWADICAYADWACLRPMTELEFEKACRGRKSATDSAAANVVANEYAWGDATVCYHTYTLSNDWTAREAIIDQPTWAGNCNYSDNNAAVGGPLRCGIFATSSTSRQTSGASYYGIMELSGNLWEKCVSIGVTEGRSFNGTYHGNGVLAGDGNATGSEVSTWPGYSGGEISMASTTGVGNRGGDYNDWYGCCWVSDRSVSSGIVTYRYQTYGGRCVRSSPSP